MDDGTRWVRIIGCEFRLTESEILSWLSCFGEVLSEISEEPFESDGLDPDLNPVGNGTYFVRMKLTRDMPNWLPMFGRKICIDFPGVRRQCNGCYGPHAKKYTCYSNSFRHVNDTTNRKDKSPCRMRQLVVLLVFSLQFKLFKLERTE